MELLELCVVLLTASSLMILLNLVSIKKTLEELPVRIAGPAPRINNTGIKPETVEKFLERVLPMAERFMKMI